MTPAHNLPLSRRLAVLGGAAFSALLFSGFARAAQPAAAGARAMTIYRDPGCGCCLAWAALARQAGYETRVVNEPDMRTIKRRLGVPDALASCHTAIVNGYVIEGHVPFDRVARLLQRRPSGVRGLAVPGMPAGAPGMEAHGGHSEPFQVFSFDATGRATVFR